MSSTMRSATVDASFEPARETGPDGTGSAAVPQRLSRDTTRRSPGPDVTPVSPVAYCARGVAGGQGSHKRSTIYRCRSPSPMSHRALADTASDFLTKHGARAAARTLLEAPEEGLPKFWDELQSVGWLGLHIPEEHGGSGYGLPAELVVVVEEMGRRRPRPLRAHRHGERHPGRRRSRRRAGAPPARPRRRQRHRRCRLGGDVELRDGKAHGPRAWCWAGPGGRAAGPRATTWRSST